MDQIGRVRESAKHMYEEMTQKEKQNSQLRKLESENRELRRQLSELKWRDNLFREIELTPFSDVQDVDFL